MGSKTVYNPPKIEKDDSFEKYLEYQKAKEDRLQAQADKEKAEEKAKDLTRRKSGAQGLTGLLVFGSKHGQCCAENQENC